MTPKERLIDALRHLCQTEGGPRVVAAEIGASPENLSQILAGTQLPSGEPRGVGPSLQKKLERRYPGWSSGRGNSDPQSAGVSQPMRLQANTFDAPIYKLGSIMAGKVPPNLFRTVLEDDAMAPDYPPGAEILWQIDRAPKPGRLVLVADKHGCAHVRRYTQGKAPGQWGATALNQAFASLDSAADGLRVIAVLKGVLEAGD